MATFIVAGDIDPKGKLPAFDGVPGAGVDNVDVAFPLAILKHGTQYAYTLGSQNTTFSGSCSETYKLTQVQGGITVTLDSGVIVQSYNCTPGVAWYWCVYGKAIPNAPGLAILTGTIAYGTNRISKKLSLLIQ